MKICQRCSYHNLEYCTTDRVSVLEGDSSVQVCLYHQCNGFAEDIYSNFTFTKYNNCRGFIDMTDTTNQKKIERLEYQLECTQSALNEAMQELSDLRQRVEMQDDILEGKSLTLYKEDSDLDCEIKSLREEIEDTDWYVNVLEDTIKENQFMYSNIL